MNRGYFMPGIAEPLKLHINHGMVAALLIFSASAYAAPQNGIGAYAGIIAATEGGTGSSGLSLGMDAQFALSENLSLNPYLMLSAERDASSAGVADGLAGLQLRRWFGTWFAGGHMFEHDRVVYSNGSVQSSAYGIAGGLLAGVEYANGWGAEVQADLLESSNTSDNKRNAIRLNLTYRWF
jgi:hypothetical protein